MSEPTTASVPWRFGDIRRLYVSSAVGFATLSVAWWGVSGTTRVSRQIAWINVAVAGLLVVGIGNCMWLLAGRRTLGERRRQLLDEWSSRLAPTGANIGNGASPRPVWVPGTFRYHRSECQLVAGKPTSATSTASHERAGRRRCEVCRP